MKAIELAARAGVSYRQLDHWVRQGYVAPNGGISSGHQRDFPADEVAVVIYMGALTRAGLRPERAAEVARALNVSMAVPFAEGLWLVANVREEAS